MATMEGQSVQFAASPKVRKDTWLKIDSYRDTTGWPKKRPEQKMALKVKLSWSGLQQKVCGAGCFPF